VPCMTVHPTIRHQPEKMQGTVAGCRMPCSIGQRGIGKEFSLFCSSIDMDQILADDGAGPQRQVANFRVAHLAVGQADSCSGCRQKGMRVTAKIPVQLRRVCFRDGIVDFTRTGTEAVEYDQYHRIAGNTRDIQGRCRQESSADQLVLTARMSRLLLCLFRLVYPSTYVPEYDLPALVDNPM